MRAALVLSALLLLAPLAASSHGYSRIADLDITAVGLLDDAPVLVTFHGRYAVGACSNGLWAVPLEDATLSLDGVPRLTFVPDDEAFAYGATLTGPDETWTAEKGALTLAMSGNANALAAAGVLDLPEGTIVFGGAARFAHDLPAPAIRGADECFIDI